MDRVEGAWRVRVGPLTASRLKRASRRLSGATASSGIILRPALVWRAWSLGFELRLEHAGAQILEVAGVRPIDDNAAIAELSALQGPLVSHVGRYIPRHHYVHLAAGTDHGRPAPRLAGTAVRGHDRDKSSRARSLRLATPSYHALSIVFGWAPPCALMPRHRPERS